MVEAAGRRRPTPRASLTRPLRRPHPLPPGFPCAARELTPSRPRLATPARATPAAPARGPPLARPH
ncbi:hypothetical protein, partial [Streptomyces sp. AC627_RSS907]|uniref:hypothetical protein n=1 Tax=Streptomyces sp. AC627_RSS907 TaxID=2823684 RepID=UPI001C280A32